MKREYQKIFWRVGQEVTPNTFTEADNYITAQQNLIRKIINRQYFGLIPVSEANKLSLSINAALRDMDVIVERLSCQAVTKDGYLIDFNNNQLAAVRQRRISLAALPAGSCYVVLRVKPFEQLLLPVENEETPFALPVYELDVKDISHIERDELPVMKINKKTQQPFIDWNYIPPCMAVRSHERLIEHFRSLQKMLVEILKLIHIKKAQLGQLVYPVTTLLFDLEQFSPSEPPFYLIQLLKKIVKIIGLYLPEVQKYSEAVLKAPYNHYDITGVLHALMKCFQDIKSIIAKEEIIEVQDFTPKI